MLIKLRSLSPFDLYKISRQSLYVQGLDTSRLLTRGEPFNFRNLMRQVSPSVDLAAVIWDEIESETTFGQIEKNEYSDYAQMSYLGGLDQPESRVISGILEGLAVTAGEWNAFGILAELPENSPLFEGFRIAGFSIWSRQQVYLFDIAETACKNTSWQPYSSQDLIKLKQLHKRIVPLFVQPMVPVGRRAENGLVAFSEKGELFAYAELYYGPRGVWTQPYISSEADIPGLISQLYSAIPNPSKLPIYLCTRSFQPSISVSAEGLGLRLIGAQTLLVKHLVLRNKVEQSSLQKIFESGSIEGSLPISNIKSKPH
ncbi:MAG: hypothetical protein ACOYKC_07320 [Anaerolineaceae bacterium]|jgi:hypothetical protein